MPFRRSGLCAALLLFLAPCLLEILGSCSAGNSPPSFVFVLIDALRQERVGSYGNERDVTPFIDSLAGRGLLFEDAIAQAPWTTPSMGSIWTSHYPSEIGMDTDPDGIASARRMGGHPAPANKVRPLAPDVVTLASLLREAGYFTSAIVSNANAGEIRRLLTGFQATIDTPLDARQIVDIAMRQIDRHEAGADRVPFFLYLHFIETHQPTHPPAPYDTRYSTMDGLPHRADHYNWSFRNAEGLDTREFEIYRSHKLALYDGSLRFIDDQLRRLDVHLGELGLRDRVVFVIASDHGEEFWDHAPFEKRHHLRRATYGVGHGQSLFGELLRVPLILSGPGVPRGRVKPQVRNLDVAPTILGLAEVDAAPLEARGIDLLADGRLQNPLPLPAYSENILYGAQAWSLSEDGFKYIAYAQSRDDRNEYLFDLRRDPGETHDLLEERPAEAERARNRLSEIQGTIQHRSSPTVEIGEPTREQLRALGYAP
jgi:choline-sulfatase